MKDLTVYVLVRFNKKSCKVDTVMTGLGNAMMNLWALNNTPKTKACAVIERETGEVVFMTYGTGEFPKVLDAKKKRIGTCEDIGIDHRMILEVKDDRFDN